MLATSVRRMRQSGTFELRCVIVRPADSRPPGTARIRRRDRHGRGVRGPLAPVGSPLNRSRAERFDDLVLQAVAQLEPRWESELAGVEFVVEEVPSADLPPEELLPDAEPVPLARLDPAWHDPGNAERPARPARIVLYRRPLLARADGEEELGELVLDVVIEEFARLLGLDPQSIDPGYPGED
jgi:predicted Zn-dependent protease with MMP-like domain